MGSLQAAAEFKGVLEARFDIKARMIRPDPSAPLAGLGAGGEGAALRAEMEKEIALWQKCLVD